MLVATPPGNREPHVCKDLVTFKTLLRWRGHRGNGLGSQIRLELLSYFCPRLPVLKDFELVQIFVDEAGTFVSQPGANLALVGALTIPDHRFEMISKKYLKLRNRLPQENGEVKGRKLVEADVAQVVDLLRKNMAILEVNVVDLTVQTERDLTLYREQHLNLQESLRSGFKHEALKAVIDSDKQIAESSLQLYLQALITVNLLHRVVNNVTLYYSQRQPKELGMFKWVVDGKDKLKVTRWETWLAWFTRGAMSTMSKHRPLMVLEEGDYSHFRKYDIPDKQNLGEGYDISKLMKEFRFSSQPEIDLELADIVITATRRALVGNLKEEGFAEINRLMINHKDGCLKFLVFNPENNAPEAFTSYSKTVSKHFTVGGRSMIPKRQFDQYADGLK
jgi:hypothetical protein